MRGAEMATQPFVADNGDVFLFNGEIFDGVDVGFSRSSSRLFKLMSLIRQIGPEENDGRKLFDLILREGPSNFFAAIRNVEGPYAFIYYQASNHRIYFARDPLGRRSLLMHRPTPISPFLFISSNGPSVDYPLNEWEEVSCDAVHCYHLLDLKGKSWLVSHGRWSCEIWPTWDCC
jgi:asparagine synthetase B (glutamine-hydrolysing)